MSTVITYLIIAAVLIVAELVYFKIADKFNIIDKPNQRSSHSRIVLRGGGVDMEYMEWVSISVAVGRCDASCRSFVYR